MIIITTISETKAQMLEQIIRGEFDRTSNYAFEKQDMLIDLAKDFGLEELHVQMMKDALIPNEKR